MHIKPATLAIAIAALLALPGSAFAHVTLQPDSAPAGAFVRLDVRVPNELDDASTNKFSVQFPAGFASASYQPVDGWKVSVKRTKLDKPVEAEGETITEEVSQMTWTGEGSAGEIGPGQFQDFPISVQIPDKPDTELTFKATQTYDNGDVVRWIGGPDSEEPAPQVAVTAAGEDHHDADEEEAGATGATGDTSAAAEQTSVNVDDSDDDSDMLAIIALIVGGIGVVMGGVALTRKRA